MEAEEINKAASAYTELQELGTSSDSQAFIAGAYYALGKTSTLQKELEKLKERNNFLEIQHSTSQSAREKVLEELAEHDRKEIEGLKQKLQESERLLLKLKNICEEHIEEFNIPELNEHLTK